MDEIIKRIKNLQRTIETSMPLIKEEVDDIIKNKRTPISEIEKMLDSLLGFIPLGYGLKEFRRLNRYYRKINTENSRVYDRFLKEL